MQCGNISTYLCGYTVGTWTAERRLICPRIVLLPNVAYLPEPKPMVPCVLVLMGIEQGRFGYI